jgi:hypothetical protein
MTLKIRLTLLEEMLGTKAANKDVFADFIASKAPDDDLRRQELDTAEHREEAGTTIFHRMQDKIGIYDYQIKGFFKDACGALRNADGTRSKELKAYKTRIDGLVFVYPRFIFINLPGTEKIGICERPLRAETAQGPRIALARSETAPIGSTLEVEIKLLADSLEKTVVEWLDYGQMRGLGQWRNSSKGRFKWEVIS